MIKTPLSTVIGGAFWTPGCTVIGGNTPSFDQQIQKLFANGEQGFFYDPNDLSTMFQDSFGIHAVTAVGQPVGLVLDKSKGSQLGSNISTYLNVIGGGVGGSAFKITPITTTAKVGVRYKVSYRVSNYTGTSVVGFLTASFGELLHTATAISTNRVVSFIAEAQATTLSLYTRSENNADFLDISIQEVKGNHAYQGTSASRPILRKNAITGANYLAFDGADDSLQTSNIDFTSTDKVGLFTGVRKLSDVNAQILVELSADQTANSGSFVLMPRQTGIAEGASFRSQGSLYNSILNVAGLKAPLSMVFTAKADIQGDSSILRSNGVQVGELNIDQGTGNYGNYPLYIGRRGGTSLPFNGHLYSLIGIGKLTTDGETIAIEKEIAKRVGVTLNV